MGDTASTKTTMVVDGNNLLVRAMKVSEGRVVLSSHGVWTAPVLIFINCLSKYVREAQPDSLVVVWDGGRSTHRLAIYEHYKAARAERADDHDAPESPFSLAKQFLVLAGISQDQFLGVEADDLVAAHWANRGAGQRMVIVSGDKDFLQLLDGYTTQIRPSTGNDEVWTINRVRSDLKCKPTDLPAVMALTGDAGDGVPGLPGFGHKTAIKFLARYDWDLEKLLESGEAKVFGYAEQARRNLALVNLIGNPAGVQVPPPGPFTPTLPIVDEGTGRAMVEWLDRYELSSVKQRFLDGSLWHVEVAGRRMSRSTLR